MAFRLGRLPVNWRTQPGLFERYWDETNNKLEEALNSILDLPVIQNAVATAQAAANAAQAAATTAQTAANAQAVEASLINSYTSGFTGALLSVTAAGVVTIQAHTRVYGNSAINPSRSVNGGTLTTGAASGSVVRVYYDDPARAGGAVTYQFSVDPTPPPVQGGNRHSVGVVVVPASGTNNGKNVTPPGYVQP